MPSPSSPIAHPSSVEAPQDDLVAQLRAAHPTIAVQAYSLVLTAMQHAMASLPDRRHLTGAELADAVRVLALAGYGPMARLVLESWGLTSTADIGQVVYALAEVDLINPGDGDTVRDFDDVYAFANAFDRDFPWRPADELRATVRAMD